MVGGFVLMIDMDFERQKLLGPGCGMSGVYGESRNDEYGKNEYGNAQPIKNDFKIVKIGCCEYWISTKISSCLCPI
jgi:hypothetical protein